MAGRSLTSPNVMAAQTLWPVLTKQAQALWTQNFMAIRLNLESENMQTLRPVQL